MRKTLFVVVVIALLLSIPILNAYGPILGSRQKLAEFHIGPVHVSLGYIK
jgi:hypothetical protein